MAKLIEIVLVFFCENIAIYGQDNASNDPLYIKDSRGNNCYCGYYWNRFSAQRIRPTLDSSVRSRISLPFCLFCFSGCLEAKNGQ